MKGPVHIIGASAIGPQEVFDRDGLEAVTVHDGHPMKAIEPDLIRYIDPVRGRRMAKVAKYGISNALNAMERAGVKDPQAIIVGTGLGCMESTERFFGPLFQNDEQLLNPTAFIQSTHNNVAGQIALRTGCTGYNYTYLHRGASFTSALLDGAMQVGLEGAERVLVGGCDVVTSDYYLIQRRSGLWKQHQVRNVDVLQDGTPGALCGEGSAFFVLDPGQDHRGSVRLVDVDMSFNGEVHEVAHHIQERLERSSFDPQEVDLVMLGYSGDAASDGTYDPVRALFPNATVACFKPLCGEYYTANAWGTWLTWSALVSGRLPQEIILGGPARDRFQRAVLYDHYLQRDHSLVLLERP
ncbi:MAG: beta-ketoacyl synthase chain length factor [Flavobacteriales bacterium]|nr:beta-ketoacyl synthase chain length factor [Flavobacteriales bacterium]